MPVVVTGADTRLGELVVAALVDAAAEVRATVDDRDTVGPLVARGVRTAVSDLVDSERFGAVLEGAHTVVHLRGADVGAGAVLDGIPDVLAAAEDSGIRRVVTLAGLAPVHDDHAGLAALRTAEYDAVVLRVGAVLVPAGAASRVPSWRPKRRLLAPLHVDDLVAAVVAADRLRDLTGLVEVDAVGADVVSAGELDRLLGVRRFGVRRMRGGGDLVGDRGGRLRDVLHVVPRPIADTAASVRAR